MSTLLLLLAAVCVGMTLGGDLRKLTSYPNALCIDGTPGGYYYRIDPNVKNWIIYHEGGGECWTLKDCYERAFEGNTDRGSSSTWKPTMDFTGMFSASQADNPYLYTYNVILIQYCDGQSYLGNSSPQTYKGKTLYFRGQVILNAILNDLNTNFKLQQAQKVIITGSSAGGIATYNHVDWWNSNLPSSAKVVGVPDAGWFVPPGSNKRQSVRALGEFIDVCNCRAGLDKSCVDHYGADHAAACFNSGNVFPYITTPLFIIQSRFDEWQGSNFLHMNCDPPNCSPDEMQRLNNHGRQQYQDMADAGVFTSNVDGVFMDSCYVHVQAKNGNIWNKVKINGETMAEAFHRWFDNGAQVRDVNICNFEDCPNSSCP